MFRVHSTMTVLWSVLPRVFMQAKHISASSGELATMTVPWSVLPRVLMQTLCISVQAVGSLQL